MLKNHPARLPVAIVAATIVFAGFALIRLSVAQRIAGQRALATQLAQRSADTIEQRLERISARVAALAAETSAAGAANSKSLAIFEDQTEEEGKLFFVPAGRAADNSPSAAPVAAYENLTARDWASGPKLDHAIFGQKPELLGPVQTPAGEWIAFLRSPLTLTSPGGGRYFAGWVAASVPVDKLIRSDAMEKLSDSGFDYQLLDLSPSGPRLRIVNSSASTDLNTPIKQVIRSTENRWVLAVAPKTGWIPWLLILSHGVLVGVFLLSGTLLTYDFARRPEQLLVEIEARDRRLKSVHQRLSEEIQQREELEKQFSHASFHDALTGLPNRRYFMDRLGRSLQRARRRPGYVMAVMVLNFDRFKNISEGLGPAAADELLTHAVRRFERCLRPEDLVVARLAGDEFAILLFDVRSAQGALSAADRLQGALAEPFKIGGQDLFTTASMGIALSSSGYEDAEELVRGAHIALSKARTEGLGRTAIFDPATREQVVTRQQLETDLHQAIERQEFLLNFQPIVSLEDGRLAGMEVLVRWQHPLEGIVPPVRFIPLAEETGLVVAITRWVLRQACLQARAWREQFSEANDFYLSVNLSAQDLRQPDLCDYVAEVLKQTGLPPGILRLEVTESMMIGNVNGVSELVSRLRDMGVPLLLDDFGTGYSSLGYLNRFKFDYIKIDRAFVSRMTSAAESTGIVRAIVHLAQDLGIKTIAEGVETEESKNQLTALGCDYGQGYYFSKPVPGKIVEELLAMRKKW